jgi:hypothetical protein
MRTLDAPPLDAPAIYRQISAKRGEPMRTRLLDAEAKIRDAYEKYDTAGIACALLDPADVLPATKDDLEGNYRYIRRSPICGGIFANNRDGRCPMCSVGRASTLDHYLPESEFPEFAVLPTNLVPACCTCQKHKRALYRDGEQGLFVHAYFDALPTEEQFLFADVKVDGPGISLDYWVEPPHSMARGLRKRLESHFARLRLREYYMMEGVGEFSDKRYQLEKMLDSGAGSSEVSAYLRSEAQTVAASQGPNHWRAVALSTLAESKDICSGAFRDT